MAGKGENFSILADVELNLKSIEQQLKGYKLKFVVDGKNIQGATASIQGFVKAGDEAKETTDKLTDSIHQAGLTYQAANAILRKTIEVVSAMTEQVYELDGAVTEFKKVSDLSGKSLDGYVDKLANMGKEVARTGSEMVEAATEFKKSGFGEEEAANLALVATQFQNVADDAITAGEASNFIISQLKAFNLQATESEHVVDALNAVSNNFAVSSSDLIDRSGV